jgi:hypothetical protein
MEHPTFFIGNPDEYFILMGGYEICFVQKALYRYGSFRVLPGG